MTESHIKDRVEDNEIHIDGYTSTRGDRKIREGGGVISYVKDHLTVSSELGESDSMNELLCIYINELNTAVITMYRPPDSTTESFSWSINKVNDWIRKVQSKHDGVRIIITGDFNLGKLEDWSDEIVEKTKDKINERILNKEIIGSESSQMLELIEFSERWNLIQNVKKPTRENRILDLIMTNEDIVCEIHHEKHCNISDHDTLVMKVDLEIPKEDKITKENFCSTKIPLYKTDQMTCEQMNKAKQFLEEQNWDNINAEDLTKVIEQMVINFCDLKNPIKTTKEGNTFKSKNRIPRQVRLWMRRKNLASKAIRKVKTIKGCRNLKEKIREAETELSKSSFKRKIDEENNAIDKMKLNPKYFYSYIKKKTKSKSKIGPFVNDKGEILKEHPADSLQSQYKSAWNVPSETYRIRNPDRFFAPSDNSNPSLEEVSINRVKIRKSIMRLKNGAAPGPDGITVEILKNFCDQLLEPLENIYLQSMNDSIFPEIWKPAHVIPVKKPGKSKAKAESFRPVSLTSHLGKVLEAIVRQEIQDFLEDNGLLTNGQHGFRKGRSCVSQMLVHCELIMDALQHDKNLDVVYLDYKKAFDKADHGVILHRLREKGISGNLGKWIDSFLKDRSQTVIANNKMSRPEKIISGVPQGSVLGPLLFLVLIDNLTDTNITSNIGIFADDTRIVKQIAEEVDASNLQSDLDSLYDWAKQNNMEFNGTKFQAIKYGRNLNLKDLYNYENSDCTEPIEDVDSTRDLGIEMSDDGSFTKHINKIIKKVKKKMGWINRSFVRNTIDFKRTIWRTYIQSVLDYGSQIWAPVDPIQMSKIENLLKNFTKNVSGLENMNYWDRLKKMKLNSMQRRLERYRIMYIWKVVSGKVPNFGLSWTDNSKRGIMINIKTYNSKTPALARNMIDQSLSVHGGNLFNLLPEKLRCFTGTVDAFKSQLDDFLKEIPNQPVGKDLYPEPVNKETCKNSNSLIDWIPYLNLRDRRKCGNHVQL